MTKNLNLYRSLPKFWKNSLAKQFLLNKDIDSFKAIFFHCSGAYPRLRSDNPQEMFGNLEANSKDIALTLRYIYEDAHKYAESGEDSDKAKIGNVQSFVPIRIFRIFRKKPCPRFCD